MDQPVFPETEWANENGNAQRDVLLDGAETLIPFSIGPPVTEGGFEGLSGVTARFSDYSIEILLGRLDVEPASIDDLLKLLDNTECDKASRFVFERDRFRFIVGRARLRQALSARLNVRPEAIELIYGDHGKPALAPRFAGSNLRFNVSHADDVAVYAFSYGREIGVDVEALRPLPDLDQIAERFFSPNERAAYFALDPCDRQMGFFNCWTRKEAFIKALGDGLYLPLDSFDVSLVPNAPAKILCVQGILGDRCGWRLSSFFPVPGFVAAVVVEDLSTNVEVIKG